MAVSCLVPTCQRQALEVVVVLPSSTYCVKRMHVLEIQESDLCIVQGGLYENVSPEVMASARPLLTGNPAADADIIKFYQAKVALMNSQPLPLQLA